MPMEARTASLITLLMGLAVGLVWASTRGFWPVAPLLVISGAALLLHLMPPIPKAQPGLTFWAVANLTGLVVALAATWYESSSILIAGLLLVVVAILVPSLQRTS